MADPIVVAVVLEHLRRLFVAGDEPMARMEKMSSERAVISMGAEVAVLRGVIADVEKVSTPQALKARADADEAQKAKVMFTSQGPIKMGSEASVDAVSRAIDTRSLRQKIDKVRQELSASGRELQVAKKQLAESTDAQRDECARKVQWLEANNRALDQDFDRLTGELNKLLQA